MKIEVTAFPRTSQGKGASRRLRATGRVPGVIYGAGVDAQSVEFDHKALLRHLKRCEDSADAVARAGVHWAAEQARDLMDSGVDGVHFYTLNKSDATRQIYRSLGLEGRVGSAASGSQTR